MMGGISSLRERTPTSILLPWSGEQLIGVDRATREARLAIGIRFEVSARRLLYQLHQSRC